jgi:transposase
MISIPAGVRVVVATAPVDGRKGMDSLAALVQQSLRDNPFSGDIFIFRTRKADRLKIVTWDGTGLWLHHKRLEAGRFVWPAVTDGVIILTPVQLAMMLEGLDWWRIPTKRIKAPVLAG